MAYSQEKLEAAAREFCLMLNAAQRCGYEVRVEMDWEPGMTPLFQLTKCWNVRITLNGVEIKINP